MRDFAVNVWDRTIRIKDENELALVFKITSWDSVVNSVIHWNIIMELDYNLEEIIVSYRWLSDCLKVLSEKNSFLLLVKIWDVLIKIIKRSDLLGKILSRIPEEKNKMKLLTQIRKKDLERIVRTAHDIWNIVEWIYWDTELLFLNLLWEDHIRKVFNSTNEIIVILHYLKDQSKDYLINIIWLDIIFKKIKTSENLLVMLNWLTVKYVKKLLRMFDKESLINLFHNDDHFYNFLLRMWKEKEKIFLNYLNKNKLW